MLVASATFSPVRVAQLALPALTSRARRSPREASGAGGTGGRARPGTLLVREDGGGGGGLLGDDEREVIVADLADAGVHGRVAISLGQGQQFRQLLPICSGWPLRKASADMRLRPSSCTSSSSMADPLPAGGDGAFAVMQRAGRGGLGFDGLSRGGSAGRGSTCTRPARAESRARDCGFRGRAIPVDESVFLAEDGREGGLRVVLRLAASECVFESAERFEEQAGACRARAVG